MKRIINLNIIVWCFFLAAFQISAFVYPLCAEDKIIAIVNNEVVTQKDLNEFLQFSAMQMAREYKGKDLEKKIKSMQPDLINKLIEDRLILQEANKAGIKIDENRIKAKISEIKKRYNSDSEFQVELMRQGLTQGDIEKKIREQFLMYSILEQKVRSKIKVRPEEVTKLYEENKKEFQEDEGREVEAYALVNEDLASSFSYNLRIGKSPQDLAQRYSFTVNKLDVRKGGEGLRKEIAEAVLNLGINEVSGPVKVDDKFYVFRLLNIVSPKQLSLIQAQEKIQAYLFEKKMGIELTSWLDELKKQSYIEIK